MICVLPSWKKLSWCEGRHLPLSPEMNSSILQKFHYYPGTWDGFWKARFERRAFGLYSEFQFSSVQSLSHVWLFATPWTAARPASLSITNSQSLPKPMSIVLVMPSNHLILCHPLLLVPSIFPSIRVFSNESALCIRWPKYCNFSFNISHSNETQDWSPLGWTGWISWLSRVFSNTTAQKHQFFSTQLSSQSNSHIHTWPQEKP